MPKISVIIPVYNVEDFLSQCLDSILNQTFYDWECILVNDGSTDKSGQICDEYVKKDTRFKVIHQSNFGVSTARRTGLELSNGILVSFIDSDDWIEPITFKKSYNIVTKSNSDVVYFPYGQGVSSTNLKARIYENYKQMKKKADNHFPQDTDVRGNI